MLGQPAHERAAGPTTPRVVGGGRTVQLTGRIARAVAPGEFVAGRLPIVQDVAERASRFDQGRRDALRAQEPSDIRAPGWGLAGFDGATVTDLIETRARQ
jgi:hypothetical protein